jgi:Tol biopolymer transport system component
VAVSQYDSRGRQSDIWVIDAAGTGRTRMTSDPAEDVEVRWSPDGDRLVFASTRRGPVNMYMKAVSGGAPEELLFESPLDLIPEAWSVAGSALTYTAADPKASSDLWLVPMTGKREPRQLVRTTSDEASPRLSPDGRWLAYSSNESGSSEVYVQPFPPTGSQWQVSRDGGTEPRWRGDGKELYYLSTSQRVMAADVKTNGTFDSSAPVELFPIAARNAGAANAYAVSRDGRRFLVDRVVEQTGAAITVVLDWTQRLK